MAFNQDDTMIDVEDITSGPTMTDSLGDFVVTVDAPVTSIPHPSSVLLNGSWQNSEPHENPESLVLAATSIKVSSRDSSVPARDVVEQLPIRSPTKARLFSEDSLSEGLESELSPPSPGISVALLPTGLCYDVRMRYHCELDPPKQRLDFHPEDPRRIYYIYRELCRAGLVAGVNEAASITSKFLHRINVRYATKEEICLVHDAKHFEFVKSTKGIPPGHFHLVELFIAD